MIKKIILFSYIIKILTEISPVYCEACQFTLQFLEYELNKDKSKQAVANAIENVCKIAPATIRNHCNSIVETYGIYLIDLLETLSPLEVCYSIKLCSHKVENKPEEIKSIEIVDLTPSKNTKNDLLKIDAQPQVGDVKCSLCLYVAELVDGLLKQNKTNEEITQELEKVCNYFPGTLKDQV